MKPVLRSNYRYFCDIIVYSALYHGLWLIPWFILLSFIHMAIQYCCYIYHPVPFRPQTELFNMTMLLYVLVLYLTSWSVDARSDYVGYIQPPTFTSWGSWGHEDWCPADSYAYGFHLKVEGRQGGRDFWGHGGDDSALNAIKLLCRLAFVTSSFFLYISMYMYVHTHTHPNT